MRKLIGIGALLLAAGCSRKVQVSSPTPTPGAAGTASAVGGATPAEAIAKLMAAAKAEDLQAFGAAWGDVKGPAREQMPRTDFEMRAFYIVKCLRNDKYTMLSESAAAAGRRRAAIQINRGPLTKQTNFTLAKGPQDRWFVENVELEPLNQICQMG